MRLALALLLLIGLGCATVNQRCEYSDEGVLTHYRLRSSVIGTGSLELTTGDCTVLAFGTEDTGLSDNGTAAIGIVAEAARKTTPSGAAGSVLEDLISGSSQDCEDDHCD
ncbi:MAG TPA: hypothetical protein VM537_10360 [Anaerolineae bacterium]|nr:hypothetical protein [Anaerolineae bacterium]